MIERGADRAKEQPLPAVQLQRTGAACTQESARGADAEVVPIQQDRGPEVIDPERDRFQVRQCSLATWESSSSPLVATFANSCASARQAPIRSLAGQCLFCRSVIVTSLLVSMFTQENTAV
jgi:hypothetical protein